MKGQRFHPEYYSTVSEVFKKHLSNLRKKAAESASKAREELYTWDDFTPRLIHIDVLRKQGDRAPGKHYVPILTTSKDPQLDLQCLPASMLLLLELCSDVVGTTTLVLMRYLRSVEWHIIQSPLQSFQHAAEEQVDQESSVTEDQESADKDSSATEGQDSAAVKDEDSSAAEDKDSWTTDDQDSSDQESAG